MSNEDKMKQKRAEFAEGFSHSDDRLNGTLGWDKGVKACAAIKDAEIAELNLCMDENNRVINEQYRKIAAQALMIKELREVLQDLWENSYTNGIGLRTRVKEALVKTEHHNPSALGKMLLEAEIKGLNRGSELCELHSDASACECTSTADYCCLLIQKESKKKLAELNKE